MVAACIRIQRNLTSRDDHERGDDERRNRGGGDGDPRPRSEESIILRHSAALNSRTHSASEKTERNRGLRATFGHQIPDGCAHLFAVAFGPPLRIAAQRDFNKRASPHVYPIAPSWRSPMVATFSDVRSRSV